MPNSEPLHLAGIHCQHEDVIERIHAGEVRLSQVEAEVQDLRREVTRLIAWVREDSRRSAWVFSAEADLRDLVETNRWATLTRRFLAWFTGAATGFLLFWEAAERWLRGHWHG